MLTFNSYILNLTSLSVYFAIFICRFEKLNEDLFQKTIDCVKTALELASVSKEDIDDIVMVGGSSRIPKIQNMVENYFGGKRLSKSIHPDEAVAHGACRLPKSSLFFLTIAILSFLCRCLD